IVKKWSKNEAIKVEPYIRQIELFKILPLAGRIIYFDDEPVAASIWEETDQEIGMANAYTHLALHEIKGVSQFVFLDMCAKLKSRGFSHVCIGGSESEGLDRFKRNLFPVESVNLSSWSAKSVHSRLPQSQKTAINLNRVAVA
ncbi:MAG TPA: hypothetical protein VFS88_08600, partial [Micavibrio sp.]|nr:hypothetical protein [Micavibrio sp.]